MQWHFLLAAEIKRHRSAKVGVRAYKKKGYECNKRYWNKLLIIMINTRKKDQCKPCEEETAK